MFISDDCSRRVKWMVWGIAIDTVMAALEQDGCLAVGFHRSLAGGRGIV